MHALRVSRCVALGYFDDRGSTRGVKGVKRTYPTTSTSILLELLLRDDKLLSPRVAVARPPDDRMEVEALTKWDPATHELMIATRIADGFVWRWTIARHEV